MHDFKKQVLSDVKDLYDGPAWHGPNMVQTLDRFTGIDPEKRTGDSHTAVEILAHMLTWRKFTIQMLKGNDTMEASEEQNFPSVGKADWERLKEDLESSQHELVDAIINYPNTDWENKVPTRDYNFAKLVSGCLQHDIYHLGQLILLTK